MKLIALRPRSSWCVLSSHHCTRGWFTEDVPSSEQFVKWFTGLHIVVALVWTSVMMTALTVYLETFAMRTISAAETALVMSRVNHCGHPYLHGHWLVKF
jgi:hypothetical protein